MTNEDIIKELQGLLEKHFELRELKDCWWRSEQIETWALSKLEAQKQDLLKKTEKPLEIIEDFIERWNKQDKEKEVAQAIQDINQLLK